MQDHVKSSHDEHQESHKIFKQNYIMFDPKNLARICQRLASQFYMMQDYAISLQVIFNRDTLRAIQLLGESD